MNLIQLKEKTEEKKRIQNLIQKAELELTAEKRKLQKLTGILKKEHKDVQKLENSGLTSMFYSFLGTKVEKLDKERQEYLSAKLKYDHCKKEIEGLESEIEKLKKNLVALGKPEAQYKKHVEQKTAQLKESGDKKIAQYEKLLEHCFSQKKEVAEAIAAGEKAVQGLNYAISYLRKAKNWGTFDMLGGGLLATAVKHSNIDEAKDLIQSVQVWLRKFKRELSDIKIKELPEMSVQIDSFSTFADYFFDNLIFDWVVQSKINRSLESCQSVQYQVSQILSKLKSMDKNLSKKYKSTKDEFTNYIETC